MPSYNHLRIRKQKDVKIDIDALNKDEHLEDMRGELFEQHGDPAYKGEFVFNLIDGEIMLYDGGYDSGWSMGDSVNTWGYAHEYVLNILAKHLEEGEISFGSEPEGNPAEFYKVTPGNVESL